MAERSPAAPRIAVLEDHDDTRELLRIFLEQEFLVEDYRDGPALLAVLEQKAYSAVIADIMMPKMDGYEFIRAVRRIPRLKNLCVIALTALAGKTEREKAIAAGFTDYLVKPIFPSEVAAVIRRYTKPDDWRAAS